MRKSEKTPSARSKPRALETGTALAAVSAGSARTWEPPRRSWMRRYNRNFSRRGSKNRRSRSCRLSSRSRTLPSRICACSRCWRAILRPQPSTISPWRARRPSVKCTSSQTSRRQVSRKRLSASWASTRSESSRRSGKTRSRSRVSSSQEYSRSSRRSSTRKWTTRVQRTVHGGAQLSQWTRTSSQARSRRRRRRCRQWTERIFKAGATRHSTRTSSWDCSPRKTWPSKRLDSQREGFATRSRRAATWSTPTSRTRCSLSITTHWTRHTSTQAPTWTLTCHAWRATVASSSTTRPSLSTSAKTTNKPLSRTSTKPRPFARRSRRGLWPTRMLSRHGWAVSWSASEEACGAEMKQ